MYGYTSVYKFTREPRFLDAACRIADYFVSRVDADGVVYWDFDAPRPGVWDVSAGMCACSGMLLLVQLRPELGTVTWPTPSGFWIPRCGGLPAGRAAMRCWTTAP